MRPRALAACLALAWLLLGAAAGRAAAPAVAVFPIPGTHYNLPQTQISFRGVEPRDIGSLRVVGSVTGVHAGRLLPDADGQGASFVPAKPFAPGETVTVTTQLNVIGASNGSFTFQIAHPYGLIPFGRLRPVSAGTDGVQHFRSRPDLEPAAVTVTDDRAPAAEGDIFVAPQFGPVQDGPMILDPRGNLVWFLPYPVAQNTLVTNFRVQQLWGQPVLTWWQGNTNAGHGRGEGVIFNRSYQPIATVKAANGLDMGLHVFLLTNNGDAYIDASSPVHVPGVSKPTVDSVVQEIDVKTGLVLFEWHAIDHVPLSASYFSPRGPGRIFDPYHINSVGLDRYGNLIISMRNTSAIYGVNHQTGQVMWVLGGKDSTFRMGPGTSTWGQHDAVVEPDGTLTVFDDGGGPPRVHPYSRGIRESVNAASMTATLIHQYAHSPQLSANFEGSVQLLPDGNVFIGWGQQPYFSEYTPAGRQIFDAHFTVPTSTYRAYRFPWSTQPPTSPALAVVPDGNGFTTIYASWNGATDVSAWRVLAGPSPGALSVAGQRPRSGFETQIVVPSAPPYFSVQALGSSGQVLAASSPSATPAHVAIAGRSAFVAPSGVGAIPASCFAARPCHLLTTITAGRTVIARTGSESIGPDGAGLLYFDLSPAGRALLAHASHARLGVTVSVRDASGLTATSSLSLVPFHSSGRGPGRSVSNSAALRVIGLTDFVSNDWVGGILAGCIGGVPCHVTGTITVGRTVIARAASEFLGANELGYLFFTLTPVGHAMLARARSNQLGAHVTLTALGSTASANIALVGFR